MRGQLRQRESLCTNTRTVSEGPDYGKLPAAAWHVILRYLDAESRLAIAGLGPRFEQLVFGTHCMGTVRCGVNSGAAALWRLLEGGRPENLRTLDLTNCVVAIPSALLACVASCRQLTDLLCVGCPLDPLLLVSTVTKWLTRLQRLDWSLHYGESLREALQEIARSKSDCLLPSASSLARMYVEVEYGAPPSQAFLAFFLRRCPNIGDLHVHIVRSAHAASAPECAQIALGGRLPGLISFTFSTDENTPEVHEDCTDVLERATRLYADINACGNVTFGFQGRQPTNCLRLEDLVCDHRVRVEDFRQLAVVVSGSADPALLRQAAKEQSWYRVECLTVIRERKRTISRTPCHSSRPMPKSGAVPSVVSGLRPLLNACRNIAELNLNAFHVSSSWGFLVVAIASGLSGLRAVSVTVCALADNRSAFDQLAANCPRLQELDVRAAYVDPTSCFACSNGTLTLNALSPAARYLMNSLERVTLCNVRQLESLNFTSELCVSELRLFNVNLLYGSDSELLGKVLRSNPNLRSLTLAHDQLPLGTVALHEDLAMTSLRFVCLQSRAAVRREQVLRFAGDLQFALPLLFSLHVHFMCVDGSGEQRITWLRLGHGGFQIFPGTQHKFIMLEEAPCVQCHASTFVGLAKPRNRYWCRL